MKQDLQEIVGAEHELVSSRPAPKTQWERILVPIDFSESSHKAFKLAITLAADPEDKITVLHVIETEHPLQRGSEVMMLLKRKDSEIRAEAKRRLEGWVEQACGPKFKVEIAVRQGNVADEILACAESRDCDLIVLATEPKRWIERLVSRSVVPQIQHLAVCDVIGIRPAVVAPAPSKAFVEYPDENLAQHFRHPHAAPAH